MSDGEKIIDDLNTELLLLRKEQDKLERKKENISLKKQEVADDYLSRLRDLYGNSRVNLDKLSKAATMYNVNKLNKDLYSIYRKSFFYLCNKRHYTKIKDYGVDALVFTTRGLYDAGWYNEHIVHRIDDINTVVKLVKKHYDALKDYPIERRKYIFESFNDLCQDWITVDMDNERLYEDKNAGIKLLKLHNDNYDAVDTVTYNEQNFLFIEVHYGTVKINLRATTGDWYNNWDLELPTSKDLDLKDLDVLSQIDNNFVNGIVTVFEKKYGNAYRNNKKLFDEYAKKVAPYIVTREL